MRKNIIVWKKLKGAEGKLKSVVLAGFSEDSHSVRDLNTIWLNVHVIAPALGCHQSGREYVTPLCGVYAKLS